MRQTESIREDIHRRISHLPEEKLPAVRDILALIDEDALTACNSEALECVLMSGIALGKELNTPEEDEAWKDFNPET
jgi:hypothetical protein